MKLDGIQLFTLEEIGIPIWELRSTNIAIQSAVLLDEQQLQADWLIIHAEDHYTKQKQELLTMMLFAIGVDIMNVTIIDSDQLQDLTFQILTNKILLVLGRQLRLKFPPEKSNLNIFMSKLHVPKKTELNIFTTYDLSDLLHYPDKKFDAWQILKLALQTYNKVCSNGDISKSNSMAGH
ncbi:MAG: DNA polymerase III subunit psi [Piscirickettsiaceae bacterium]|nr:DNA polymerase III subunit psi [Piscirickettsiaceae bacterium]